MQVIVFIICFIRLCKCLEINLKFGFVSNEDSLHHKKGYSLQQCYEDCQRFPEFCTGIAYNRYNQLCVLYKTSEIPKVLVPQRNFVYSSASTWKQISSETCDGVDCTVDEVCETSQTTGLSVCAKSACPEPQNVVPYATLVGNMNGIRSKRMYRCDGTTGLGTPGSVIECLPDGTWMFHDQSPCLPFGNIPASRAVFHSRVYHPTTGVSRHECILLCYHDINRCMSVEYMSSNGTCQLKEHYLLPGNGHHTSVPEWELLYKVFPVFIAIHSSGILYDIPRADAPARCLQLGTVIASRADVELAWSMGFSQCRCGFVNGMDIPIISMRYYVDMCIGVGVNSCWDSYKSDVFCRNTAFHWN